MKSKLLFTVLFFTHTIAFSQDVNNIQMPELNSLV
jgi:hypothetical protein